ncbi:MAG: hypothetical protein CVV27_10710 [Candidatus Melainabacteria bacterium HGW-Melainabacteria-1]|nr:MAG: hypothetical protein CVV27_10710 [Candidatus Melainabacteria bacterium HGW-Melainabacteria-1]
MLAGCWSGGPGLAARAQDLSSWPPAGESDGDLSQLFLHADQLTFDGDPLLLRLSGNSRVFGDDWRLLAQELSWAPDADWLHARGRVELAAPAWLLQAESLAFRPAVGYIQAEGLQLKYQGLLIQAARAEMTPEAWLLQDVELRLADSPLVLRAARLRLLPRRSRENLMLEAISLPGLPWAWPVLTLSLPELAPETAEVRSPLSLFQPEFAVLPGGLRAGLAGELWLSSEQRWLGRLLSDPLNGPLAELSHEWRPQPGFLLHSQLGLGPAGLQARVESLWQTPLGPWLRGRARWQQVDSFWGEFWLPPLQPVIQFSSGLEFWGASDWLDWGPLRTRLLAGARWPQQQIGATWLGQWPLWQEQTRLLEASWLFNTLAGEGLAAGSLSGLAPTAGGRLLFQQTLAENLTVGGYLEQYLSALPASTFLHPERLSPWLSGFVFWQALPDLGFGLEVALSLNSGRPVLADALVSWRLRPFYLHLLLQGIPAGIQLQTRFEL